MNIFQKSFIKYSLLFVVSLCFSKEINCKGKKKDKPLNVILLIGDGMGLSQVSTTFYYGDKKSNFRHFEQIGLINTSSASHKVTDSAAGATAFSSGIKTYNQAIGVNTDTSDVLTMFEMLSGTNYKTGIVATSSVVHATPAAFYAHVPSRHQYDDIALQLTEKPMDFFAGGGLKFFENRKDGKNLMKALETSGVNMNRTGLPDVQDANFKKDEKYGYILSLDALPKISEYRGDFLPNATSLALKYLSSSDDGFFLMVESSQIDWAGHANDENYLIDEMRDFNKTLKVVLDFAKANENTLVVVTADHETGGFTLAGEKNDYNTLKPSFSTNGHSATLIPVFAFGKGAEKFRGIYENTNINHKIVELLNLSN